MCQLLLVNHYIVLFFITCNYHTACLKTSLLSHFNTVFKWSWLIDWLISTNWSPSVTRKWNVFILGAGKWFCPSFWSNRPCETKGNQQYIFGIVPFCRLNEEHLTFHLQYEHSRMLAYRKYEELKKSEIVLPHHSQPSRENATPSSGTYPLASYKEVRP